LCLTQSLNREISKAITHNILYGLFSYQKIFSSLFFSTELKVFFYDLSFKILSEVYRPELADRLAAEFIKLTKDVSNLVCWYCYSIMVGSSAFSCWTFLSYSNYTITLTQLHSLKIKEKSYTMLWRRTYTEKVNFTNQQRRSEFLSFWAVASNSQTETLFTALT